MQLRLSLPQSALSETSLAGNDSTLQKLVVPSFAHHKHKKCRPHIVRLPVYRKFELLEPAAFGPAAVIMAALGPSGLFHSQGVCDRRPRQLLSKHTISPGARRARSAFRGRSPVKVQAATPQQVLHELPLPTGDWTCNIPVLGETLLFTADPAKWSRER